MSIGKLTNEKNYINNSSKYKISYKRWFYFKGECGQRKLKTIGTNFWQSANDRRLRIRIFLSLWRKYENWWEQTKTFSDEVSFCEFRMLTPNMEKIYGRPKQAGAYQ